MNQITTPQITIPIPAAKPIPKPNSFFLLPLTICHLVWSSTINVHLLNSIRIFLCCGWIVPPSFVLFGWVSPCLRSRLELNDQECIVCDSTNSPVAADKATLAHSAKIVFKSTIYERLLELPLKTGLSEKVRNTLKFLVVRVISYPWICCQPTVKTSIPWDVPSRQLN